MAAPNISTCSPWSTADEVQQCQPCTDVPDALLTKMLQIASDILYERSGRRFPGTCTDTVRPCAQYRAGFLDWSYWAEGSFYTWGYCGCNRGQECGCNRLSEILLGAEPVTAVTQVKIDGAVIDPSQYRVDDHLRLVALTDGLLPCCQDLDLPSTEEGTFEVTFSYGTPPPPAGKLAAEELACQLALSCTGSAKCKLPAKVQSVTRQGVSLVLLQDSGFLKESLGLYASDAFVNTYNPAGLARASGVWSPDIPRSSRRTDT